MTAIRGHFDGRVFVPEEPVNLPVNQEVIMHVEIPAPTVKKESGGVWAVLEKYAGSIEAPADWSAEHDHYLYGTPKRHETGKE